MAVDDDSQALAALGAFLESHEIRPTAIDDPLRFWKTLQETSSDLLVLDVDMPHLSGSNYAGWLSTAWKCTLPGPIQMGIPQNRKRLFFLLLSLEYIAIHFLTSHRVEKSSYIPL